MLVVFYTVRTVYSCVFIMSSTSYCLCDNLMDPWNIAPRSLKYKKRQLELWKAVGTESHIETFLRNYKFCLWHHNIYYPC